MSLPKEYLRDRLVLLLLTVSAFLTVLGTVLILLRFQPGRNEGYIVQCRNCSDTLDVSRFTNGRASDLLAFIVFMVLVLAINTVISTRVYRIHRQFAVAILGMGILLIVLAIIVSNALLVLK